MILGRGEACIVPEYPNNDGNTAHYSVNFNVGYIATRNGNPGWWKLAFLLEERTAQKVWGVIGESKNTIRNVFLLFSNLHTCYNNGGLQPPSIQGPERPATTSDRFPLSTETPTKYPSPVQDSLRCTMHSTTSWPMWTTSTWEKKRKEKARKKEEKEKRKEEEKNVAEIIMKMDHRTQSWVM